MDITTLIATEISNVLNKLGYSVLEEEITITQSNNRGHGDYTSNIALKKARQFSLAPMQLASMIADNFKLDGIINIVFTFWNNPKTNFMK